MSYRPAYTSQVKPDAKKLKTACCLGQSIGSFEIVATRKPPAAVRPVVKAKPGRAAGATRPDRRVGARIYFLPDLGIASLAAIFLRLR